MMLLSYAIQVLATIALIAAPFVAHTRARAGAPLVPVNRFTVVWATLLLVSLLYHVPAFLAGPEAGRASCATDPLSPGCTVRTLIAPNGALIWFLLTPIALYAAAYALVRVAPAPLRARFGRLDRALEEASRSANASHGGDRP